MVQSANTQRDITQFVHAVPTDQTFVVVESEVTGNLIEYTGHPIREHDARRVEALRRAREAAGTQSEDDDAGSDGDVYHSESEDSDFAEDRRLRGTNGSGDIETFQKPA